MKYTQKRKRLSRIFEKYIRLGLRDGELDVFSVCRRIRGSCRTLSGAKDIFAVWELCRILRMDGREEELKIFNEIYLKDIKNRHNDINMRVISYAMRSHCDPRTAYRRLAYIERRYDDIRSTL